MEFLMGGRFLMGEVRLYPLGALEADNLIELTPVQHIAVSISTGRVQGNLAQKKPPPP